MLEVIPAEPRWLAIRAVVAAQAPHRPEIDRALREHAARLRAGLVPVLQDLMSRLGRTLTVDPGTFTDAVVAAHVGAVGLASIQDRPDVIREAVVRGILLGLTHPSSDPDAG